MFKLSWIALGTALFLAGAGLGAGIGTSKAAGVAASGISVLPKLAKSDSIVEQVRHRSHRRTSRYSHHHNGFWYAFPFWLYSAPAPYYGYSDRHAEWCLHRYRSYNSRTDLYLGYDGRYHRCRSPYRR